MIRLYKTTDLEPLRLVFRQNTPVYFAEQEEQDLVDYLNRAENPQFVFEEAGLVLGTAGYYLRENGTQGGIAWVFVAAESHGKGVGSQLVGHCLAQIRQHPAVQTITVRTSQHADRFFARFGFRQIYFQADYWAPGIHLCQMEMRA